MDLPSSPLRFLSAAIHTAGASILAYCFAVYTSSGHFSWKNWRQMPWARLCIVLVFVDSWLFHVSAGLLVQGSGIGDNKMTCTATIYLCITIYCLSKILIYCFLIERVYVVWPHNGTRLSSKAYCVCVVTMFGYVVITTLMIIGKNAFFDSNRHCIIGLKGFASIPLLSYDLFLNVFLTAMFLWPLQQAHFRDVRLRKIAIRTLFAAVVALTTSAINIFVLTIKHGKEAGWICLLSCGIDVSVNALVLYWVTGYRPDDGGNVNYLTTIDFTMQFTSQSLAISSRMGPPGSRPEIAVPVPARDKAMPNRAPSTEAWPPPRIEYAGVRTPGDMRAELPWPPDSKRHWRQWWWWRRAFWDQRRVQTEDGGEKGDIGSARR